MSEKRILVVEDEEYRRQWFRYTCIGFVLDMTKDTEKAKRYIDDYEYVQIFLDHDLADDHYQLWGTGKVSSDETTGYAVADYLARYPKKSPDAEIIIHSLNDTGSKRMYQRLKETRENVRRVPFTVLKEKVRV